MGIFGRVPSGGGPGTSRRDRRQAGARGRSKTAAKRETEQRAQVFVVAGIILTAIALLGVGAFGYYQTSIQPKREVVLKVGDRKFRMGDVEKRLRYEAHNPAIRQLLQSSPSVAVVQTLNAMEAEEVIRIGAANGNVSVSEDEIDARIRQDLGLADSVDEKTFADAYRNEVHDSGLSADRYREIVEAKLLEDKVRQNLRAAIPTSADQVRIRDIQVATEAEANKVVERLAAGEDFAALVIELSLDSSTKDKGGEIGWTPRAALDSAAADAVFAVEAGQWTQPVLSANSGSYFVYQVEEKAASMEVTADQQTAIENQGFVDWLKQTSSQLQIETPYVTDTEMFTHLAEVIAKEGTSNTGG